MDTPEAGPRGNSWFTPSTILILCFGMLVPIAAALIPAARGLLKEHDFRYSVSGPVTVGKRIAFAVTVTNRGRQTEKDVQIRVPHEAGMPELEYELTWAPPGTQVRDTKPYKIFVIGDLKPEEMARISVMMSAPQGPATIGNTRDEQLVPSLAPRVVSAHGEASWAPATRRASLMRYVYQAGFWGFIIIVVTALAWAIGSSRFADRFHRLH
jgi:Domain of unknown function DUF11